jgi:hypothetical protein
MQPKGVAGGETGGIISALAFGVRVEERDRSVVATFDHRYKVIDSWVSLWVEAILPKTGDPAYPLLGNLDPYDDTIFNGWQTMNLIRELKALDTDPENAERRETIRRLIDLCSLCEPASHRSIRFIGD